MSTPDLIVPAKRGLRAAYCLALFTIFPSMLAGAGGWIGLVMGGGLFGITGGVGFFVLLVLVLFRVIRVVRVPSTLDARVTGFVVAAIRRLGIGAMTIGLVCAAGLFFVKPIALFLFGRPGDAGVAYFVTGIILYFGSNLSWGGVLLFEMSRLLGGAAGKISEPVRHEARIAGYAVAGVAVLGVAVVCIALRSEHQTFIELCSTAAKAKVLESAGESFESVLVEDMPVRELARGNTIQASEIALLDQLSYVEYCAGTYCQKITNSRSGNPSMNNMQQIGKPVSVIVFAPLPPAVRSASMGATIYELEYRVSDRRSRKTLASASEFVFDWGRFSILRTLVAGGSTASVEACGYALPQPHMFRSNVYRDPTWEAYSKADKELIVSVLPSGRVSTSGK